MALIAFLLIVAIILIGIVVLTVGVGGPIFIIIFADVIVCIGALFMLIKALINKKE